ncbi:MAG: hypothetical protein CVV42_07780 [Candidatus Riflebacteria bacterium HGW-Riflebacteria-2]|jgi:ankyrin repeat protein|nr:MAG: hypothetical protein CVV42_07780 [Candidatus Riflebacteria bacterium HGW-Riflebacteria-2]
MIRARYLLFVLIACLYSSALFAQPDLIKILSRKEPSPGFMEVRKAIRAGADVNKSTDDSLTPLMTAITNGVDKLIIKELIKSGADVRNSGIDILAMAARFYRDKDVLEILIEAGCKVDSENLRFAIAFGNLANIKYLIEKADKSQYFGDKGIGLLHWAAAGSADSALITFLLEKGFGVNRTDDFNQTPLIFWARSSKNMEILRVLLNAGASINHKAAKGHTPLIWAIRSLNVTQENALSLIKMGADVNLADDEGKTPLIWAASYENKADTVKALLQAGARARKKDKAGFTALDYAVSQAQDAETVDLLLPRHRTLKIKPDLLNQAMFLAIDAGNRDLLVRLLKMGANPNSLNELGANPIQAAAFLNQKPEIFSVLIKAGTKANVFDDNGMTAMHWAAAECTSPLVIEMLARAGELVDAKETDADMTPLMIACFKNPNEKVIEMLIKHGANVNATDTLGRSPLSIAAASFSNVEVIKTLLKHGANPAFVETDGRTIADLIRENNNYSAEEKARMLHIHLQR